MRLLRLFATLLLTLLPTACGNLNFYSEEEEASLGAQAYAEETGKYPLITRGNDYEIVQRVGRKIAEASGKPYQWEFKLLKADDVPNAFCLPGGKVAIYTGILPITQTEAGLAAVMGHEVAHATERHGGKRMTQGNIANVLTTALGAGLSLSEMSPDVQQGVMKAFAIGAQVGVLLPYSRDHETEADEIGIRYAIRAGYDPWEAPKLWERMAALSGDGGGPAWLSTHPASLDRAENLKQKIPLYLEQEKGWKPKQLAPSAPGGNR